MSDEITVIFNYGTRLKAELSARINQDRSRAAQGSKPDKPLKAVKFGDSESGLGEWGSIAPSQSVPHPGWDTVTRGIVSARNRDINFRPRMLYIRRDASINPWQFRAGRFQPLEGEVVGVTTAIISFISPFRRIYRYPSLRCLSNTALPDRSIESVRPARPRRGLFGVLISCDRRNRREPEDSPGGAAALVAGVVDKDRPNPSGIEPVDWIIKFDCRTSKEMRDHLPPSVVPIRRRPIGKHTPVLIILTGKRKRPKKRVTLRGSKRTRSGLRTILRSDAVPDKGCGEEDSCHRACQHVQRSRSFKIKDGVKACGSHHSSIKLDSPAADSCLRPETSSWRSAQERSRSADDLSPDLQAQKDGRNSGAECWLGVVSAPTWKLRLWPCPAVSEPNESGRLDGTILRRLLLKPSVIPRPITTRPPIALAYSKRVISLWSMRAGRGPPLLWAWRGRRTPRPAALNQAMSCGRHLPGRGILSRRTNSG